jgi:hypothetical protein
VSTDGLGALFATLAPALAPFNPGPPSVRSGVEVIAQLEDIMESAPTPLRPAIQAEIDRYKDNVLLERGIVALGSTPEIRLLIDRFESETGAAADFPERRGTEGACNELALPDDPLVDVVVKRCNAPAANKLSVIAHRADIIVTLESADVPEEQAIEPVVATLAEIFRAIDPLLTP